MKKEIWRTIFEVYQVSNKGRVRRIKCGNTRWGTKRKKINNPYINSWEHNGYMEVSLCINGKQKHWKLHQLIALAFLGNCPSGKQINHKNLDKTDNRLSNLEYVTCKENVHHAIKNGVFGSARIPIKVINSVRNKYATGNYTQSNLGKLFKLSQQSISRIVNAKKSVRERICPSIW